MSTSQTQFSMFTVPEKKKQSVDLKSNVKKYLYHWPLFIIALILTVTAAYIYMQTAKPIYQIKATLLIKDQSKAPEQQQSALHEIDLLNSSKIIENEIEVLKSKQLISQVVQDLQLWVRYQKKDEITYHDLYKASPVKLTLVNSDENFDRSLINITIKDENSFFITMPNGKLKELPFKNIYKNKFGSWKLEPTPVLADYKGAAIKITIENPENTAFQYQKLIDASLPNKLATAVVLSLDDQVAQRGKDILNDLIFKYNSAATVEKNRETQSTLDFLDRRLDSLTGELTRTEKGIETFKSSRGLTDITSNSKISLENMQANDTRLNEVNVQLSVIEGIERYVNSSQNSGRAPATLGITDVALTNSIEKLEKLQLQRDQLLATTPETNPDFEPLNRQIAATKAAIKENVKNIKSSLLDSRAKLQSINARVESSIKGIPTEERQYVSIKRQQTIKESLYNYLLQKREEIAVSYASTLADDRIVDQAYAVPVQSKGSLVYALAIVLGIALPAGFIYGRNKLNTRITNSQDIKDILEIPIISELPFEASEDIIDIDGTHTKAINEQFRILRTKLYYLKEEKEQGRIMLLTSGVAEEGKSFISRNLAVTLAHAGRKTIILELDMRRPKIAEAFKLQKEHPGITDFLKGTASKMDIVQNSGVSPDLDIISSGAIVNNPSELLEKRALTDLVNSLREFYDDIIIDSPPVNLVADAMILSRLADITLFVIRQGFTEKTELNFIKELYDQKQLLNIHIIFNGIQKGKYGYGYSYDNNYYNHKKTSAFSAAFSDFSSRF